MEEQNKRNLIIILEDEDRLQTLLSRLLASQHWESLGANNGEEGIKLIEKEQDRCALLITDLLLPICTGWEVLEYMKQNPACAQIKKIIMTGAPVSQEEQIRLSNLVDKVLIKGNFSVSELRDTVQKLIGQPPT